MRVGKLTNEELRDRVLAHYTDTRDEVVLRPNAGIDCAALDLGGKLCVLSCDPITSAGASLGKLAVHVSCNDAAASGAEPIGLMVTLLAPPDTAVDDIERFAIELGDTAKSTNVDILGGHTELTASVTRMIAIVTVVAKCARDELITPAGMRPGDALIMTKWAGLEGTTIIAGDYEHLLEGVPSAAIEAARTLSQNLSVLPEGRIAAKHGAHAMHDITEGGVIAALNEMAEASSCSATLYESRIPILDSTRSICGKLNIDPLRLLSSGCMLIASPEPEKMLSALRGAGIKAEQIGVAGEGSGVFFESGLRVYASEVDEIYRIG